jgi:hypothetical protein
MKKTVAALTLAIALLIIAEATMFHILTIGLAGANPINSVSVPSIQINYPPYPPRQYENSTVQLEIYATIFNDSPKLNSISYSLDGDPWVYLENITITTLNEYGPDRINFTVYTARVNLENLPEGNHTVIAHANGMSTSRTFTVNSHHQVTVAKILSPMNQTYSKMVPLVFTVNGEIKEAHYYLYRGSDAVFENSISGNTTLNNLPNDSYVMHLYVTTEKGEATTSTYFVISNNDFLENPLVAVGIAALMMAFAIAFGVLFYFKKRKH